MCKKKTIEQRKRSGSLAVDPKKIFEFSWNQKNFKMNQSAPIISPLAISYCVNDASDSDDDADVFITPRDQISPVRTVAPNAPSRPERRRPRPASQRWPLEGCRL